MTTASFEFRVIFSVMCYACKKAAVAETYLCHANQPIRHPELPDGWKVVDGRPLCTDHILKLMDVG